MVIDMTSGINTSLFQIMLKYYQNVAVTARYAIMWENYRQKSPQLYRKSLLLERANDSKQWELATYGKQATDAITEIINSAGIDNQVKEHGLKLIEDIKKKIKLIDVTQSGK